MPRGKIILWMAIVIMTWMMAGWITWFDNSITGNPEIKDTDLKLFMKFGLYGPLGHRYLLKHCNGSFLFGHECRKGEH